MYDCLWMEFLTVAVVLKISTQFEIFVFTLDFIANPLRNGLGCLILYGFEGLVFETHKSECSVINDDDQNPSAPCR